MPRARVSALLTTACLSAACGIPYGGDFESPRWDPDGRHIFYLEQRFIMAPHPYEYWRLYRALPDKSDRDKIDSGSIRHPQPDSGSMTPSPDGKYLLYLTGYAENTSLVIWDVAAGEKVREFHFPEFGATNAGWLPDSRAVYYRLLSSRDLLVVRVDGGEPDVVFTSAYEAKGWSADGQSLYYSTGNGWPGGNRLFTRDLASGREREILAVPSGLIGPVVPSPDGARIAFPAYLIEGKRSALYVADASGGAAREVWSGATKWLTEVHWAAQPDTLVFDIRFGEYETGLACLGPDRVARLIEREVRGWDYHRGTDQLVETTKDESGFSTRPFGRCDSSLSELQIGARTVQ